MENEERSDLHRQMEQWNQEKENKQSTKEDQTQENEMYRELYRQTRVEEEEQ